MKDLNNEKMYYKINKELKKNLIYFVVIGVIITAISFFHTPIRFWVNILINNFYFVCMALSGMFFLALQNITNSSWMRTYQRIPEAMMQFLPVSLILMLFGFLGYHSLYEWTHHDLVLHDPILIKKILYLNIPFYIIRMVAFFLIWIGLAKLISFLIQYLEL